MKKAFLISLALAFASVPLATFGQTLTVLAEENPPFNSAKEGASQGAATDLFLAMASKAGMAITRADVQTQPWARAYETAQAQPNTILMPMARTPAREDLFKWVGPIYKVQIGLIAPKARKIAVKDGASAAKFKIGTVRDGAPEQAIVAAGVPIDSLDRGTDLVSNLKKLQSGRVDMIAFNAVAARFNMAAAGMNPDDYEVVFVLSEPQLYFAAHKDTSPAALLALQNALDAMKKDGTYDALMKKFIK